VGEKGLDPEKVAGIWKKITNEAIFEFVQLDEDSDDNLKVEDIGVKKFVINHGLKEGDHPLNHVKFFNKRSDAAYSLPLRKLESMTPKYNQSWTVRCFIKP